MRTSPPSSLYVNWDLTYACPLRCEHCYSESGRRASKQAGFEDQLRIADRVIEMNPQSVQFSGGEPLIVPRVFEIAEHFVKNGVPVHLYTSGWNLDEGKAARACELFSKIHVSIDGPTAEKHDGIRGRKGSFDRAMRALEILDGLSRERARAGMPSAVFGVDCSVFRSTFDDLGLFCTEIAPRFPEMGFMDFGAVAPTGLANRAGFAHRELLTEWQTGRMRSAGLAARLRALAPPSVRIGLADNLMLRMHPDDVERGSAALNIVQIEPDGGVRGMAIYEGTVGNLLRDPVAEVLEKVRLRPHHPFVVETLGPVRTNQEWAAAAREIDWYFGAADDLVRIAKRADAVRPEAEPLVC